MKKAITVIMIVAAVVIWITSMLPAEEPILPSGDNTNLEQNNSEDNMNSELSGQLLVHFIDVGQGDSAFIELPNKQSMLIDAGERDDGETIESYIRNLGYSRIDYLVMTHPHADHIGSAAYIIRQFDIGEIYMPEKEHTSATFENMLDAVADKGYQINAARAGVRIFEFDGASAKIISPSGDDYESLNDYSAVVKLTYGEKSFLFMGDAEALAENEILSSGYDVDCDVIKIGHHGSSTSSSERFITAASPELAIISLGKDNSYGHPHREVKALLNKYNIPYYRTDELGSITVVSDGVNVQLK